MELGDAFRTFGRIAGPARRSTRGCARVVAASPELLALAARVARGNPENILLAAIHDELLRDPGHALAAYYPTAGGHGPGPGSPRAIASLLRRARRPSSRPRW